MELSRRRLLSVAAGTAGTGILAGCTGGGTTSGSESDTTTARASFFVFGDLTERVAGETAATDLLVPVGQHGHGWEPGPSVREDIRDADLFVHGMPSFQPWVDDIKTDLDADSPDVSTVDVSAGLAFWRPEVVTRTTTPKRVTTATTPKSTTTTTTPKRATTTAPEWTPTSGWTHFE